MAASPLAEQMKLLLSNETAGSQGVAIHPPRDLPSSSSFCRYAAQI